MGSAMGDRTDNASKPEMAGNRYACAADGPAGRTPARAGALRWTVLVYVLAWIVAVAVFAGLATATPAYDAPSVEPALSVGAFPADLE